MTACGGGGGRAGGQVGGCVGAAHVGRRAAPVMQPPTPPRAADRVAAPLPCLDSNAAQQRGTHGGTAAHLRDGQRVVQVAQRVKLPLLALHRHKELLDALRGGGTGGGRGSGRAGTEVSEEGKGRAGGRGARKRRGSARRSAHETARHGMSGRPGRAGHGAAPHLQRQLIALDQDADLMRRHRGRTGARGRWESEQRRPFVQRRRSRGARSRAPAAALQQRAASRCCPAAAAQPSAFRMAPQLNAACHRPPTHTHRVGHELVRHLQHLVRQRGADQHHLRGGSTGAGQHGGR